MTLLSGATEEEMAAECKRRKESAKPQPIENPNFSKLISVVTEQVLIGMKDGEHYVYEAAVSAVFGKDVWKWYNNHRESKYLD